MAQKVLVSLTDDLASAEGEEIQAEDTVEFGLDGKHYEIDLCGDNADRLRSILAPYVTAGRRPSTRASKSSRSNGGAHRDQRQDHNDEIRFWARRNGYKLADRGRIPAEIVQAYREGIPNGNGHSSSNGNGNGNGSGNGRVVTLPPVQVEAPPEQRFPDRKTFRRAVRDWAAEQGRPIKSPTPSNAVVEEWKTVFGEPIIDS